MARERRTARGNLVGGLHKLARAPLRGAGRSPSGRERPIPTHRGRARHVRQGAVGPVYEGVDHEDRDRVLLLGGRLVAVELGLVLCPDNLFGVRPVSAWAPSSITLMPARYFSK